ncbi:MAG: PAS domain-containing protein [Thermoplasmata archaeon]|nr:PAS domain-containing protein [Thermoplasmata archaeon]
MKGSIDEKLLPAVMDTLPAELTFIDENDLIVFWNEPDSKIFHRADEILGTDIRKCHPEKSQDNLEKLLGDLKSGAKDKESMRIECDGLDILIKYIAVRSDDGKYKGCLETCRLVDDL